MTIDGTEALLRAARELVKDSACDEGREADHHFVEVVTFSSPGEIVAMLDRMMDEAYMEFPVWARNLAYRLAVLQSPADIALRRRAANDLLSFGPDWDDHANALIREADDLEKRT